MTPQLPMRASPPPNKTAVQTSITERSRGRADQTGGRRARRPHVLRAPRDPPCTPHLLCSPPRGAAALAAPCPLARTSVSLRVPLLPSRSQGHGGNVPAFGVAPLLHNSHPPRRPPAVALLAGPQPPAGTRLLEPRASPSPSVTDVPCLPVALTGGPVTRAGVLGVSCVT